jgi:hypothetical protein
MARQRGRTAERRTGWLLAGALRALRLRPKPKPKPKPKRRKQKH